MTMPDNDLKKQLHQEILDLWERYKALHKTILLLQGDMSDLDKAIRDCGKRIYELYTKSDEGLDS